MSKLINPNHQYLRGHLPDGLFTAIVIDKRQRGNTPLKEILEAAVSNKPHKALVGHISTYEEQEALDFYWKYHFPDESLSTLKDFYEKA